MTMTDPIGIARMLSGATITAEARAAAGKLLQGAG
jgi:DNA repair ATPase RecN